jgi:hypothetical protein
VARKNRQNLGNIISWEKIPLISTDLKKKPTAICCQDSEVWITGLTLTCFQLIQILYCNAHQFDGTSKKKLKT